MALFTGKGDTGTTKLFDTGRASKDGARHDSAESGKRVMKSAPIFECLGQLDELNTIVGWTKTATPGDFAFDGRSGKELLEDVQDHLFTIQAEVVGAQKSIPQSSVETLSSIINSIEKELPEIKTFLVPGVRNSLRGSTLRARCRAGSSVASSRSTSPASALSRIRVARTPTASHPFFMRSDALPITARV